MRGHSFFSATTMHPNPPNPDSASSSSAPFGKPPPGLRHRLYTIIFEADTKAGRRFDQILVIVILFSILVVIMDSVHEINASFGQSMSIMEWGVTILFTVEYMTRLACVRHPFRYATSFFGIVDLLSILPSYIALLTPEASALLDVRILRLIRIFRIFKLTLYVAEYTTLGRALRASRRKILIFLSAVLMVALVLATLMYVLEGPENGYTSIPVAMYWAIVTMTTVGYGDITPHTNAGKLLSSLMMLLGWGILAVPTGIVTAEMTSQRFLRRTTTRTCPNCLHEGLEPEARFCSNCGAALPEYEHD